MWLLGLRVDASDERASGVPGGWRRTRLGALPALYRSRRPDDAELRVRLRALAHERRRFGYRRFHILLRREGGTVNRKRVQRLYREERLMVRKRGGCKRVLGLRAPLPVKDRPNACWSLDFVHDQMTDGRRIRVLVIVDHCTRDLVPVEVRRLADPCLPADLLDRRAVFTLPDEERLLRVRELRRLHRLPSSPQPREPT